MKRSSILVVDDSTTVIHLVSSVLEDYHMRFALNGKEALEIINNNHDIDLILLDVEMPEMNGYEVIKQLKSTPSTANIPVIFLTVRDGVNEEKMGFELGAVDYINKPISVTTLKARVDTHINLHLAKKFMEKQNEILENKVKQRTREIMITQDITINSMMLLLEVRDLESSKHIIRTQLYVKVICDSIAAEGPYKNLLKPNEIENIIRSAPLHDIGKVGIPDSILLKPGNLSEEEFEHMKMHTIYASKSFSDVDQHLGDISFLNVIKEIASCHHEKWDGSGYPLGLKGKDIPLAGRIMALADVYDALITKRVYKDAYSHEVSKNIIIEGRGTHFDPVIVDVFLENEDKFIEISNNFKESRS